MQEPKEHAPAESIAVLDAHISYIRRDVALLLAALPNMATKADIADLARRLEGYATKDELRALEVKLSAGSVQSTFDRWATAIQKAGAAAAVVGGAAVLIAKLMGKL